MAIENLGKLPTTNSVSSELVMPSVQTRCRMDAELFRSIQQAIAVIRSIKEDFAAMPSESREAKLLPADRKNA